MSEFKLHETDTRFHPLSKLMSEISEECWCAGWMLGTEYDLFKAVYLNKPRSWGQGEITQAYIDELQALAQEWGCWFYFDMAIGPMPIYYRKFEEHCKEKGFIDGNRS